MNTFRSAILFITTRPNYYNFGYGNFNILNIADTDAPIVSKYHKMVIDSLISNADEYETIYVCCDAGLSRSPAVALYMARKLNLTLLAEYIDSIYRFYNRALLRELEKEI
ncbi:dual specificity protein phosphatase family protein [candidate division WOR-3 bacterium]|nr:dual specificity protein phosphatase family protein [candidate division WOR-3 bacterium]